MKNIIGKFFYINTNITLINMQLEKKYYIPIQDLMFSKKILCIALESDLLSEDELDVYTAALEEKNMAMEVFICIIKHNKALVSDSFTIDQESSNMGGTVPFVSLYHHVILQSYEDDTENFISFKDIPLFGVDVEDLKAPNRDYEAEIQEAFAAKDIDRAIELTKERDSQRSA